MRVEVPPMDCPMCGERLRIVTTGNTVVVDELVVDFTVYPCEGWCRLLQTEAA